MIISIASYREFICLLNNVDMNEIQSEEKCREIGQVFLKHECWFREIVFRMAQFEMEEWSFGWQLLDNVKSWIGRDHGSKLWKYWSSLSEFAVWRIWQFAKETRLLTLIPHEQLTEEIEREIYFFTGVARDTTFGAWNPVKYGLLDRIYKLVQQVLPVSRLQVLQKVMGCVRKKEERLRLVIACNALEAFFLFPPSEQSNETFVRDLTRLFSLDTQEKQRETLDQFKGKIAEKLPHSDSRWEFIFESVSRCEENATVFLSIASFIVDRSSLNREMFETIIYLQVQLGDIQRIESFPDVMNLVSLLPPEAINTDFIDAIILLFITNLTPETAPRVIGQIQEDFLLLPPEKRKAYVELLANSKSIPSSLDDLLPSTLRRELSFKNEVSNYFLEQAVITPGMKKNIPRLYPYLALFPVGRDLRESVNLRVDLNHDPIELLGLYVDALNIALEGGKSVGIELATEDGFDLGGLTRNFLSNVFGRFVKNERYFIKEGEFYLPMARSDRLSKDETIVYENMGHVLMHSFIEQKGPIGSYFRAEMFSSLVSFTPSEVERPFEEMDENRLVEIQQNENFKRLWKYCQDKDVGEEAQTAFQRFGLFIDSESSIDDMCENCKGQILETIRPQLEPLHAIASGMWRRSIAQGLTLDMNGYEVIRACPNIEGAIQGFLDPKAIRLEFRDNIPIRKQNWLKKWIEEVPLEKVRAFIEQVTGTPSLPIANQPIKIADSGDFPAKGHNEFVFQTCGYLAGIPFNQWTERENFVSAWEATLCCDSGFDMD